MILLTILLSIIYALSIVALAISGSFLILFGDVLVFTLIIVGIIKYLKKHNHKDGDQ